MNMQKIAPLVPMPTPLSTAWLPPTSPTAMVPTWIQPGLPAKGSIYMAISLVIATRLGPEACCSCGRRGYCSSGAIEYNSSLHSKTRYRPQSQSWLRGTATARRRGRPWPRYAKIMVEPSDDEIGCLGLLLQAGQRRRMARRCFHARLWTKASIGLVLPERHVS